MRLSFAVLFTALIITLVICAAKASRSSRSIAPAVKRLLIALIPPMLGNLIIIVAGSELFAAIGGYTYYVGIDITIMALLFFTTDYCGIPFRTSKVQPVVNTIMLADMLQILANIIFGHAFALEPVMFDGSVYYRLVPFLGQTIHRVLVYGVFMASIVIFAVFRRKAPRLYKERYTVILFTMLLVGLWQTFYIFSRTPVDRSMIGYGVFGILIYYFAIRYRPMRLLDRLLANVVSDMSESLFFFEIDGGCIYANTQGMRMLGIDEDSLGEANEGLVEMFGPIDIGASHAWESQQSVGEDGDLSHYALEYRDVFDEEKRRVGSYLSVRDCTEEENVLRRETYLATHDRLTGLYNRECLYDRVREVLDDRSCPYVIVALDVNDFKLINDIYSNEFGDRTLRSIADMLRSVATPRTVYGRLSGDKFGAIMPKRDFNERKFERILSDYTVSDGTHVHRILMHMGVYEVVEHDIDVSIMFDHAFMAMETIKSDYQRHIAYYDDAMRDRVVWSQSISTQLNEAMEQRQIRPYFQPMVNADGRVVGCEALVRWIHPVEGFLSPARFIPVFEENGMIAQLDRYMWECSCQKLAEWQQRGVDLFISVNISPKDFYFLDVYAEISRLVRRYRIDPSKLRLEITETVMMSDLEKRLSILEDLRADGFLVEMDDFGSGYSSLNMLKDMPVDVLKIDMMFLYKTKDQQRAATILQTIINLSRDLGIPSLTEGVETEEQVIMLTRMGCNMFQGYYFAKPMPEEELESFLGAA